MRQLIAYTVLLSQDQDGRWKHGLWADKMETHCIFQASGIDVLVDYYEISSRDIFIEKAKTAADYLIDIAENLSDDKLWFLHDSLELNLEDAKIFYKDLVPSTVFGKSESNTLCLNSHLWTMIVLERLNNTEGGGRYSVALQNGNNALKMVLNCKPMGFFYAVVYYLRDYFNMMAESINSKITEKLRWKYDSFLKKGWMLRFKARYPRLVMPNGFTERDISASLLMDDYHLVNMSFLLSVYRDTPSPWLKDIIDKCMRFTMRSSVIRNFGRHNPKIAMVLEILVLYTAVFGEKYLPAFTEYATLANAFNFGLAIDIFSNPQITGPWNGITVSNENVILLSIPSETSLKAVLINTSDSNQLVELVCENGKSKELCTGIDISGKIISLEKPIDIKKGGIIKIAKK
jgi:hypothetical protein